jgi:hypothetical protein
MRTDKQVQALASLMEEIVGLHQELLTAVDAKIEAMRSANTHNIEQAIRRERQITDSINDREGLRRRLTENIARGFGVGGESARRMNAAMLADRFGGVYAAGIRGAAEQLKLLIAAVARRNDVAQRIARSILGHMRSVFSAMTATEGETACYAANGAARLIDAHRVFDTVG